MKDAPLRQLQKNLERTLEKRFYQPVDAWKEYKEVLSEARCGISLYEKEISYLDEIISPLIRKKQSLHHICVHHPDSTMISESTLYRFVDYNLFQQEILTCQEKFVTQKRIFPL